MKRLFITLHRQENGAILILSVLIIMVFASFCMVPLLDFMGTGLKTTVNTGLHTQEIYAAEAGVYDSMWKMIMIAPGVPKGMYDPPLSYSVSGGVNDKSVNVTIARVNSAKFRIHSVARNQNTGHQSTVDTDVAILGVGGLDLTAFSKYAMTTNSTIGGKPSDIISGQVWIPSSSNYTGLPAPSGGFINTPITGWPTAIMLETYFSYLVNKSNPHASGTIDLSNATVRGPLYAYGAGTYTMTNAGTLTGTIYINGNLQMDNACDVHLNGNTVFVTGDFGTGPQTKLVGPGAVIALGNVNFQPQVEPEYLFVMSVLGSIQMNPGGHFFGALSANAGITLQPNVRASWEDPGIGNLDLPGLYNHIQAVETWSIK
jgi:hypothetical protein